MYWLLGRNSQLTIGNQILIYVRILKLIWMYGIQLCDWANETNLKIVQTFQNKVQKIIVDEMRIFIGSPDG